MIQVNGEVVTIENNMNGYESMTIPNKAFDMEYATQWKKEKDFLSQHGFEPTFVKKTKDYGIKTYKYTKTSALFETLNKFFAELEREKLNKDSVANG